jgi:hypothetical protein
MRRTNHFTVAARTPDESVSTFMLLMKSVMPDRAARSLKYIRRKMAMPLAIADATSHPMIRIARKARMRGRSHP